MKTHKNRDEAEATPQTHEMATAKFKITYGSNAAEVQLFNAGKTVIYKITQCLEKGLPTLTGLIGIKEAQTVMNCLLGKKGDFQNPKYNSNTEKRGASEILAGGIKNALQSLESNELAPLETSGTWASRWAIKYHQQEEIIFVPEIERVFMSEQQADDQQGPQEVQETEADQEKPPGFENNINTQELSLTSDIAEGEKSQIHPSTRSKPTAISLPVYVRHSKRLREKYDGLYVSILERAKKKMGYEETVPRKTKKKGGSAPILSYMENMDQLTQEQAEVVLATAGISGEEDQNTEVEREGPASVAN